MTGRPRGEIYDTLGYQLLRDNRKYKVVCLTCNKELKNIAVQRLKSHRSKCSPSKIIPNAEVVLEVPILNNTNCSTSSGRIENVVNIVLDADIQTEYDSTLIGNDAIIEVDEFSSGSQNFVTLTPIQPTSSTSTNRTSKPAKNSKANKISNYIDIVSQHEETTFNNALGEFFFGCNIPFAVVESDHFKKFITLIRPAYASKLPSRKVLSSKILDRVHENCTNSIAKGLGPESVLLIDGWKNVSNNTKTVVTILHAANGERAFLNAWDMTGSSETGEALANIVTESEQIAASRFHTSLVAVVSDNATAMVNMGRRTALWHSTCNSHTANLFAKDIIKPYNELLLSANKITKMFKHPDLEQLIRQKGGRKLRTICDVRWCSYRDNLVSLIENLQIMKEIAADNINGKKVKQEVKRLLFDDELIENIQKAIDLFNPVCELIDKCQNRKFSLAEAVDLWIKLQSNQLFENFSEELAKRKKMALNVYALSAYFLHPAFDDNHLVDEERSAAVEFIIGELSLEGIEELDLFKNKSGFFKTLFEKKIDDAIIFWNMAAYKYPNLSKFAKKLFLIPASSSEIERIFSSWSFVHSPNRNRLGFEKSKKLLEVYYSLKISDSLHSAEF